VKAFVRLAAANTRDGSAEWARLARENTSSRAMERSTAGTEISQTDSAVGRLLVVYHGT
jgi:hypothetical protein